VHFGNQELQVLSFERSVERFCEFKSKTEIAHFDQENSIYWNMSFQGEESLNEKNFVIRQFNKIPFEHRLRLRRWETPIKLLSYESLLEDPSFENYISQISTHSSDGRQWSDVPAVTANPRRWGAGIWILSKKLHLPGSENLFQHEFAHALDWLINDDRFTSAVLWKAFVKEESTKKFLEKICGDYCLEQDDEAFAEIYAFYYSCEASRNYMLKAIPAFENILNVINSDLKKSK